MVKVISGKRIREGRGFSLGEFKSAGLPLFQAKRLNISVDERRQSVHDFNVKELSEMASKHGQAVKAPIKTMKKSATKKEAETTVAIKSQTKTKRAKTSPSRKKKE